MGACASAWVAVSRRTVVRMACAELLLSCCGTELDKCLIPILGLSLGQDMHTCAIGRQAWLASGLGLGGWLVYMWRVVRVSAQVNVNSSATNCGTCGRTCNTPNALPGTCSNRVCSAPVCLAGYGNCNQIAADGCEVRRADASVECTQLCLPGKGTFQCQGVGTSHIVPDWMLGVTTITWHFAAMFSAL